MTLVVAPKAGQSQRGEVLWAEAARQSHSLECPGVGALPAACPGARVRSTAQQALLFYRCARHLAGACEKGLERGKWAAPTENNTTHKTHKRRALALPFWTRLVIIWGISRPAAAGRRPCWVLNTTCMCHCGASLRTPRGVWPVLRWAGCSLAVQTEMLQCFAEV